MFYQFHLFVWQIYNTFVLPSIKCKTFDSLGIPWQLYLTISKFNPIYHILSPSLLLLWMSEGRLMVLLKQLKYWHDNFFRIENPKNYNITKLNNSKCFKCYAISKQLKRGFAVTPMTDDSILIIRMFLNAFPGKTTCSTLVIIKIFKPDATH